KLGFADLAQNLLGVLAQPRRRALGRHWHAVERDRRTHAWNHAAGGSRAFSRDLHAAMHDLWIGKRLREIVDRACRYADRLELLQERVARELRGELAEMCDQLGAMCQARFVVDEFFLPGEIGLAQHRAQLGELPVVARGDDDMAVGDWKHLIWRD